MSLSVDGKTIFCDGEECRASVPAPVALRPARASGIANLPADASGWLFVVRKGVTRHYCPCCIPLYLTEMTETSRPLRPGLPVFPMPVADGGDG